MVKVLGEKNRSSKTSDRNGKHEESKLILGNIMDLGQNLAITVEHSIIEKTLSNHY
jgi:hypothetical protein